ncbi:MAG TPA: PhaM family polyhydroxyalkanoate granule multifunctional regulatory protein [Advenella sp.]|nr:PhaM family polyhydroxyalkanoate granule multifunctional regulatory protein [Advenella sp.]
MTSSNPFDRPGLGPDSASNPIMQSLDMMSKAWQQFAQVQQASNPVFAVPPALNPEELDKRIQELKSIESWLTMNLSMLSGTIQGLEIQRASIHTLKTFVDTLQTQNHDRSLDDLFGLKKPAQSEATTPPRPPFADQAESTAANSSAGFAADSVSQASQAWWDMLQGQFAQLAQVASQATQAMHKEPSPVKTPPGPEPDEPVEPQEPVKPATRKRAAASRPATKRSATARRSP